MRPIDKIINVKVRGDHLTKDSRNAGVQHEANVTYLRIDFDEGWDPYAKTVTFWDALMGNPTKLVLTTDKLEDIHVSHRVYLVPIPGEALGEPGDMTFVVDGWTDGKRKRSLADTLWVKEAPFEEEAGEPTDPTPSQAEQMQVQLDLIISDIQKAEIAALEAFSSAEYARNQADSATSSAQFAQEMADYSYRVKEEAVAAQGAALAAQVAAEAAKAGAETAEVGAKKAQSAIENMSVTAGTLEAGQPASVEKTISGGVVHLKINVPQGEKGDKGEKGERGPAGPAGAGAGDMVEATYDPQGKATDIFAYADNLFAPVERAKAGGEIDQRLQNRVEKSGDSMTGILTFETPGLFCAIQKKRTIGSDNYIMRLGVGNYGTGGTISLRLVTVGADGTETGAGQFDIDKDGLVWVTPGGLRKTVAHSGNIGLLTASVE